MLVMDWQQGLEAFNKDNSKLCDDSINKYYYSVRDFFRYCPKDVEDVTAEDVKKWRDYLISKYKTNYSSKNIERLRGFFNYLYEEEILDNNPAKDFKIPRGGVIAKEIITKKEYRLLIEATQNKLEDQVMFAILYSSGVRVNELVKLKVTDINWKIGKILVNDDKTAKQHYVPLTYECLTRVKIYLNSRQFESDFIFTHSYHKGNPIKQVAIQRRMRIYKKKLGFNKQLSPYIFRYTFASNLYDAGFDIYEIADMMGHDDISITRSYIKSFKNRRKHEHDKYCQ